MCPVQPVTALHHVAGIDRLAAVCDGNLLLLDPESLKEWHVPGAKVRMCYGTMCAFILAHTMKPPSLAAWY